jgi:hypothetical protein
VAKEIFLQPYVADAHANMQRMWIVYRGLIRSNVTKLREITLRMTEDRARNPEPSADLVIRTARQITGVATELAPDR